MLQFNYKVVLISQGEFLCKSQKKEMFLGIKKNYLMNYFVFCSHKNICSMYILELFCIRLFFFCYYNSNNDSPRRQFVKSLIFNNQSILEGLIRAMPQLTERNQLM